VSSDPVVRLRGRLTSIFCRFLYILMAQVTAVGVLRLDGPGNATLVQTFNVTTAVEAAGYQAGASKSVTMTLQILV
jgi:hypothetical protein